MQDRKSTCQARHVTKRYMDRNGHYRKRTAACGAPATAVDLYGYGYCDEHHDVGDYGHQDVDLDAVLEQLRKGM